MQSVMIPGLARLQGCEYPQILGVALKAAGRLVRVGCSNFIKCVSERLLAGMPIRWMTNVVRATGCSDQIRRGAWHRKPTRNEFSNSPSHLFNLEGVRQPGVKSAGLRYSHDLSLPG
jgi:hypothetical protein